MVRRRLTILFAAFTAAAVAFGAWVFVDRVRAEVGWQEATYAVRDDARVSLSFDVTLADGVRAVCTLQARNHGFAEVGRIDAPVGPFPGGGTRRVTVEVPTSERAVYAVVRSCAAT